MKVALTQSAGRLAGLEEALTARGFEVVRHPLVETEPILSERVRQAGEALLTCDWLLFPSISSVEAWRALGLGLASIAPKLGAVGKGTAEVIGEYGGNVILTGEPQTAAGLAARFLAHPEGKGSVGLPRGERALPTLEETLKAHGILTCLLVLYRTRLLPWNAPEVEVVLLSSPSAVEALPPEVAVRVRLVAIGSSTAAAIRTRGWSCVQAERPDAEAILAAIEALPETEATPYRAGG